MSVEAEQLEEWIGSEVVDPSGEKLGKIADVYYRGADALIVEIRSGIIGRTHSLAALAGATVSTKHLRLASDELVPTDGGVGAGALEQLSAHDQRLAGLAVEDLESDAARGERLKAAQDAADRAASLDAEASRRGAEAATAAEQARNAHHAALAADQARSEAEENARQARREADELGR